MADQVYWFLLGRPWTASVKAFVTGAISGHPKGMCDWARAQLAVSFKIRMGRGFVELLSHTKRGCRSLGRIKGSMTARNPTTSRVINAMGA